MKLRQRRLLAGGDMYPHIMGEHCTALVSAKGGKAANGVACQWCAVKHPWCLATSDRIKQANGGENPPKSHRARSAMLDLLTKGSPFRRDQTIRCFCEERAKDLGNDPPPTPQAGVL